MTAVSETLDRPLDMRGRLTPWKAVFALILVAGAWATIVRFAQGLGAATHLSDAFPWGLWIGFDVLVGVGLAAGGFVIAATVHVFAVRRYEAIARPAVLTAFLGYLLVIAALMFDLGRPYRIWHPLVMWNPHSVMFEVAWCVMLYTTVLALEFSPLVFEKLGLKRPLAWIRALYVPLVIAGVMLSTLHQSSLGTLYVIAPDKLHGLWYTPLLPVFFFMTAIAGGLAMTIFESFMSNRAFGKRLETPLLHGLGRIIVVVLAVYAVFKLEDLAARDNLHLAFELTPESVMFWGEMGLGVLLPMVLFAAPWIRRNESGLFFAAVLTVMGFTINRLNVAVTGMSASSGVTYVPSWMEFAVTVSIVAVGFALFALAVKYLNVFPASETDDTAARPRLALTQGMLLALWGLLAVGVVLLVASSRPSPSGPPPEQGGVGAAVVVAGDRDLDLPEPVAFPTAEGSPGEVVFDHAAHVDPVRPACATCHGTAWSMLAKATVLEGELSFERIHDAGGLCASCHDGARGFSMDSCELCHRAD